MGENKEMGGELSEKETPRTPEEEREYLEYYVNLYAVKDAPVKEKKDCERDIVVLEQMFAAFEMDHPLAELYAIIDLSAADAPSHPIRQPALEALKPIGLWLAYLEKETNITPQRYTELLAHYAELTKAVGMIIGSENKIRHEYVTGQ